MADNKGHVNDLDPSSLAGKGDATVDISRFSEAVIELNIARKNVSMYPPGHVQVQRSIGRAFTVLKEMTSIWPSITMGVAKDTLLIGEQHLDSNNPVFRDFAFALNRREIAAVTFAEGLKEDELARFEQILVADPDEITNRGGIEKVISLAKISNITVQALDFSSFHLTEEDKITLEESGEKDAETNMWQGFVSQLLSGTLDPSGQGRSVEDSMRIDPAKLAKLLNESQVDAKTAAETYERIVAQYVRMMMERARLTEAQSATLAAFVSLMKNLKPHLRKQFLSVTSQCLSSPQTPDGAEDLLEGFPDDMVIEMIRQINEEGGEIPAVLLNAVQRMTFTEDWDSDHGEIHEGEAPEKESTAHISQEQMETLFEVTTDEKKGDSEYDATLKALSEGIEPETIAAVSFPLDNYKETLEDSHLDLTIGRALLSFIERDPADSHYEEFLSVLLALVPDLLDEGRYSFLLEILQTLRTHAEDSADLDSVSEPEPSAKGKTEAAQEMAKEALKTFEDPDFVSKAVSGFPRWADRRPKEAANFLLALGPGTVPGLIDLYAEEETPRESQALFKLLVSFGKPAVSEALERLEDTRSHVVRNLLLLIRHAGTDEAVPHVRPLVKHEDLEVRMEALAILLRFKDPTGIILLREFLLSKDRGESSRAVTLAGAYGGNDVAEDLVSMLVTRPFFKSSYTSNEMIIQALGEIGNPAAVPHLERLARSKWILYPASLSHMKAVLFESLEQYPKGSLEGLLYIGMKSDNPRIKRACKRILQGDLLREAPMAGNLTGNVDGRS